MRLSISILVITCLPLAAFAQTPATVDPATMQDAQKPEGAKHYSAGETDIGALLDNPATRAVLDKYLPGFSDNPQTDLARPMTLAGIQPYMADVLTEELLKQIDADLAKIPMK